MASGLLELEGLREDKVSLEKKVAYLESLIEPFKQQLVSIEEMVRLEKAGKESASKDFERVLGDYAGLMGHANPRQKILHIMKLKDELATSKKVRLY